MSTSAAVLVESVNKVVRVNSDGYPEHMVGALAYIEAAGLTEVFASQAEYAFITDGSDFSRLSEVYRRSTGYVEVPAVGWAFTEPIEVTAQVGDDDAVQFSQEENHHYILRADGSVHLQDDTGKWVTFD